MHNAISYNSVTTLVGIKAGNTTDATSTLEPFSVFLEDGLNKETKLEELFRATVECPFVVDKRAINCSGSKTLLQQHGKEKRVSKVEIALR